MGPRTDAEKVITRSLMLVKGEKAKLSSESGTFDANASKYHVSDDDLLSTDLRDSTKKTSLLVQKSPKQDNFYWTSPLLLLGTFVAAIIFVVGHHLYYNYLDGRAMGNSSSQQWALR